MHLRDIHADDILGPLGLQTRRTALDYLFPALGILGAGIVVGAGLGLLFAPKSGAELRHQISGLARRHRNDVDAEPITIGSSQTEEDRAA